MKSGKLNFLEPSGPLQACNETACLLDTEVLPIGHQNETCACRNFINPVRLVPKLKFCRIRTLLPNIVESPVIARSCRNQAVNFLSCTFSSRVGIFLLKSHENRIQTVLSNTYSDQILTRLSNGCRKRNLTLLLKTSSKNFRFRCHNSSTNPTFISLCCI